MAQDVSIVLVDDSRAVLSQVQRLLAEIAGASVVGTARSGAEALRIVSELKPDLVLMDIVMPEMDGLSALRLLRAKHPDLQVAMLSSVGGSASKAEEAFRLGAIQVLGKPVDKAALESIIERLPVRKVAGEDGSEREGAPE